MLRVFFSSLIALIWLPILIATLIVLTLRMAVFEPSFYKNSLKKADAYAQVVDKGVSYLINGASRGGGTTFGPFTAEEVISIVKQAIPIDWLEQQTNNVIDGVFTAISDQTNSKPPIIIPLSELKSTLSENLAETINTKISALPECSSAELKKMQSPSGDNFSLSCKPPGIDDDEIKEMIENSLFGDEDNLIESIPDEYDIGTLIFKGQAITTIKTIYNESNKWSRLILIAALIPILLLALLNIKHPAGILKWIFWPILIGSFIVGGLAVLGQILGVSFLGGFLITLPEEFKSLSSSLIWSLAGGLFGKMELYSGLLLLISIIVLILAFIWGKKFVPIKS